MILSIGSKWTSTNLTQSFIFGYRVDPLVMWHYVFDKDVKADDRTWSTHDDWIAVESVWGSFGQPNNTNWKYRS